jgi:hypothetical protein
MSYKIKLFVKSGKDGIETPCSISHVGGEISKNHEKKYIGLEQGMKLNLSPKLLKVFRKIKDMSNSI